MLLMFMASVLPKAVILEVRGRVFFFYCTDKHLDSLGLGLKELQDI